MKKIIITASVVAGIALGAVSCSNASPPQALSTENHNPAVITWANQYGLPGTRAVKLESENNPGAAINDGKLILDQGVPAPVTDVNDAYTAAVEDYLTLAYDEYDDSYARIPTDQDTANQAYVVFLTALNRYGMNLTG